MHAKPIMSDMKFSGEKRSPYLFFVFIVIYLYGADAQLDLQAGDDEYIRVNLSESFVYYTTAQDTFFVNTNGLLSFGEPYANPPTSLNNSFPPGVTEGVPIIAPFYADIDTTFQGNISVTEVNDIQTVDTILSWINVSFEHTSEFTPSFVYNVSWEGVERYLEDADMDTALVNTFSCVLASDGERSYVLLMYSNISWTEAPVKNDSTNSSLPAWLGFSAGDGIRYTSITDTFSISVDDVSFTSNVNQSGLWIFRVDGSSSVSGDINECLENNGNCEDICIDTEGSFMCQCSEGTILAMDNRMCEDINECLESNGNCEDVCINTESSFMCECSPGKVLAADNRTCEDINECSENNGNCEDICINTSGSFACQCFKGRALAANNQTCEDINECLENNGNCEDACINTEGSFMCECSPGKVLAADNRTCEDINECSENNGNCGDMCINTNGSFVCQCFKGRALATDNQTCEDINECLENNGNCEDTCINTNGSFVCECLNGRVLATDNQTCEDCIPGDIRLVNGTNEFSGRVEVCISGHPGFGTVCDDHWDALDAQVACRQLLGYSVEAIPVGNSLFGEGDNVSIVLDDVTCYGNETSLEICRSITSLTSDIKCSHFEDAGVICNASCIEGSVRLLVGEGLDFYEGLSQYDSVDIYDKDGLRAGRIEVCSDGMFVAVCGGQWDNRDASVVCRQLGLSSNGAIGISGSYFGKLTPTSAIVGNVGCNGTEDGILNCSHSLLSNCPDHEDAALVVCHSLATPSANCSDGDLRLLDGMTDVVTGMMEGRLEICINQAWGSVCVDHFGSAETTVVCNFFNLTGRGAEVLLAADQGFPGSGPIFLTTLGCLGDEASLLECHSFFPTGIHSCDHSQDVWIKCIDINECETEEVACPGANSECVNTLGSFRCQCRAGFAENNGSCLDMNECEDSNNGCDGQCINIEGSYDCLCTNGRVWSADNHSCEACPPGEVRLVNGTSVSGRVEVCINGTEGYGTVCDDQWDKLDAQVVCRQLGYMDGAIPVRKAFFGMGRSDQAILLDDVSCSGEESILQSCSHVQSSDCDHSEDAGVICSGTCINGTVRLLVGEGYDYYEPGFSQYDELEINDKDGLRAGRVEVCIGGQYGTVCDDEWDNIDASVVCRQLGFSPYGAVAWSGEEIRFSEGTLPSVIGRVSCSGDEVEIIDCHHVVSPPCGRFSDAGVICQEAGLEAGNCSEGSLRLTDGSGLVGWLEICVNNAWGTICGTQFGSSELEVACAQLGGTAVRVFTDKSGIAVGPIYLSNLNCQGTEGNLLQCSSQPIGLHSCNHMQDVSIECEDINECAMDNGGCQHICNNTMGSFECSCQDGYLLDEGGRNCTDIDECFEQQLNNCSEYANCTNTDRGFECSCMVGFSGDGVICDDIDECVTSLPICGSTGMCVNTNGSFVCVCPPGFEGDICSDVDECATGTHECDINANCTNMEGSFNCSCNDGFTGNGLQCSCMDYDVLLFGGTTDSEGQVGVCINNTYTTICDDFWDDLDAGVICRQLNLDNSGHAIATSGMQFGNGTATRQPALDHVRCLGNESRISECLFDINADCGINEGAGVICQYPAECKVGSVRLNLSEDYFDGNKAALDLHGGEKYLGRVEVCFMNTYHTVCYKGREDSYAPFICKELGFSPYGALAVRSRFFNLDPSGSSPLQCADTVNSVNQCSSLLQQQCVQDEGGVVCQVQNTPVGNCSNGDVRLAGGSNVLEGRVEICFNNAWGTVCGDTFSNYDAHVVCTSIGHPFNGTIVHPGGVFGEGDGPIFLSSLACDGTERFLLDCHAFAEIGIHNCLHSQDVGVTCIDYNECAINNGNCSQICANRVPDHQCSCRDGFTLLDDGRQCIDINECSTSGNVTCHENAECVNTEGSFTCVCSLGFTGNGVNNCTETCITGSVQLVSDDHQYRGSELFGRVEMCVDGEYGTICDDSWGYNEASVVCRQLGYSPNGAVPLRRGIFGDLSLPTLISGVSCDGSESKLLECQSNKNPLSTCGTFNDAAIVCQNISTTDNCTSGELQLFPSNYSCNDCGYVEGRVEVCINNAWGTVCGDSFFSPTDAGVLCGQLGGYFTNNSEVIDGEPGFGPIFLERLECTQEDTNILECPRFSPLGLVNCDHSLDVSIRCTDIDECTEDVCSQICNNTLGSYFCSCESGYRLLDDGATCEDIDECVESNETCPNNSRCTNTNASFICDCGPGFQVQNGTCQDVDECLNIECHSNATCENVVGSFMCACNDGFTRDGLQCVDINECFNATLNNCDVDFATCKNSIGNFTCECMMGFEGDGINCRDVDECTEQPDIVMCDENANCTNVIGSYGCICNPGYNGTGFTCTDIDECSTNNHSCDDPQRAMCTNNEGSFTCKCRPGYSGSGLKNECECYNGSVRLMNGTEFVAGQMEGRVEVCNGNTYFTVCNDYWDALEANVVCRCAGHNSSNNVPVRSAALVYGSGDVMIQLDNLACRGDEPSLLACSRRSINQHICNSSDVAGVICGANCMNGSIRLVVGNSAEDFYQGDEMDNSDVNYIDDTLSQGRVEICIQGSYGTICADSDQGWSNEDAAVVCNELGFTKLGATAVGGGFFTEFSLPAVVTNFQCRGDEAHLYDCLFNQTLRTECIHDAAVICQDPGIVNSLASSCVDGDVRLVQNDGGVDPFEGRVEICINNIWGSVCNRGFNAREAEVICRQLNKNFEGGIAIRNGAEIYGQGNGPIFVQFTGRECIGTESQLLDCVTLPLGFPTDLCNGHDTDAAIICGINECAQEHTCGSNAECIDLPRNYTCMCKTGYTGDPYRECTDIDECSALSPPCDMCQNTMGSYECSCNPGYRTINNGTFMYCEDIDECQSSSNITCSENAHCNNIPGSYTCVCNEGYQNITNVCQDIDECTTGQHNCSLNADCTNGIGTFSCKCRVGYDGDGVNCTCPSMALRLMNDSMVSEREGRVEICYNNTFNTICDDFWDDLDARVVCNQLGFTGSDHVALHGNVQTFRPSFGKGNNSILLDNVICSGNEPSVLNCTSNGLYQHNCNHSEDAAVVCQEQCTEGSIRLLPTTISENFYTNPMKGFPKHYFIKDELRVGRVEVCTGGVYGTVCDKDWDNQDASVVCHQLGFSPNGAISGSSDFSDDKLNTRLFGVNCNGTENFITECQNSINDRVCGQHSDAQVICQDVVIAEDNCTDGDVRLVRNDEITEFEGRVEVCVNNAWGTVSSRNFDALEVQVICRQKGFGGQADHRIDTSFDKGSDPKPIFLSGLNCDGNENSLLDCQRFGNPVEFLSLSHSDDIGIHCAAQCSEFREDNEFYGTYVWPADTEAEAVVIRPCVYQCGNITGVNASRTCLGSGSWSTTDFTNCPTERTCQLVNLTETAMPVTASVSAIENIVDQSGIEDQNDVSFRIISQQFNRIAGQSSTLDKETTRNVVLIVDSVQRWRQSATESQSPELIQSFETIISNVVQQPDFTNISINTSGLTFIGEKKTLSELAQAGRSFSLPSDGIGGMVGSASENATTNGISLPSGIFSDLMNSGMSTASLAFTAYQNSTLFPLPPSEARNPRFQIASSVIGASIVGQNISQNVSIFMTINQDYKAPVCVFWNTSEADWKSDGCSRVIRSDASVKCNCNHLTNFAILANTNPVVCDANLQEPNSDFTDCIDRTPDVSTNVSDLDQSDAYEKENNTYRVGYGHEFGLECITSSFFKSEWRFNNMPLTNHQPGQLYAFSTAMYITVLRTPMNIGIQDVAGGVYTCVAINGQETNSINVTIKPTGWSSFTTYLRFSKRPKEIYGSSDFNGAFLSTEILLVVRNLAPRVAVTCSDVPRRPIDVMNNSSRYECSITATNVFNLNESEVMNNISEPIYSEMGFCDYEMMINTTHGDYSWMETEAEENATLECFFEPTREAGADGRAMRRCCGPRMWLDYYGDECITAITYRFRQLANETVTAETAGLIVSELSSVVSAANDTVDQSADNLEIVSNILSATSSLAISGNLTADDSLVNGSTIVVGGITVWPEDVLRNQSSGIVNSFEAITENLVELNDNFTNITLQGTNLFFQGTRMETEELQANGAMFDIVSVINALAIPNIIGEDDSILDEFGSGSGSNITHSEFGSGSESESGMGSGISNSTRGITPEYFNLSIVLPSVAFDEIDDQNETGIVLSFYLVPSLFPVSDDNLVVGCPVLAASIAGREVSNLSDPVIITLQTLIGRNDNITLENTMCVSWNFSEGDWTNVGCQLVIAEQIICKCNHLTNFAILVDIKSRFDNKPSNEFGLEVITYIGAILSIAGLLITIITLIGSKAMRKRDITKFHIQLCIALIAMLVVFLIGIDRKENEVACTFMSCVILYFALSSVFWMGAEAVVMYKKLIVVFGSISIRFVIILSILCWGVPLLFVIIALCTLATGHNTLVFKNQNDALQSCFISDRGVFFGIFLAPIALTIIFNTIMFILGVYVLIKSTRQKIIQGNDRKNARNTIKLIVGICGLMILFGLAWIFGILTINIASKVFQYLFVIFNVFQGFYFFIFICLLGKDGRNFWIELFRLKSFKKSLLKSSFTESGGQHSQLFKSARSESTTISSKNTFLSSSSSSAGLVFRSPHEIALELVPGNLNMNDKENDCEANINGKKCPLGENQKEKAKLAMIAEEETSLNDTKEEKMNKDDIIMNVNFTEDTVTDPDDKQD